MTLLLQVNVFMAKRHVAFFCVTLKVHEVSLLFTKIGAHFSPSTAFLEEQ